MSGFITFVGWVMIGMISAGVGVVVAVWGLVEIGLASLAGAWLYREPVTEPKALAPGL